VPPIHGFARPSAGKKNGVTDNAEQVARIVGSGAPAPDPDNPDPGAGDLEYDQVHDFLAEMDAHKTDPRNAAPPPPSPDSTDRQPPTVARSRPTTRSGGA